MSGPKVVRIVTREEIIAICEGHLARLDAALEDWVRLGRRNDCLTEDEIAAGRRRRDAIAALLSRDAFMDVQKQAPQEVAYLQADLQSRLAKVAEAQAAARAAARRQGDAAKALLDALQKAGKAGGNEIEERLQAVIRGAPDPKAIADGFALLSAEDGRAAAKRKELAQLHRDGVTTSSLQSWMRSETRREDDGRLAAVDRKLAELSLVDEALAESFSDRSAAVEAESSPSRRDLLLDSLELDLVKVLADAKARATLQAEIRLAFAELGSSAPAACAEFNSRGVPAEGAALDALLQELRKAIESARRQEAAEARRVALLDGLASLGYEIRDGMQTAWAADGRVVLRSAARPNYGVEVAGDAAAGRLQVRAVAFAGAPADRRSDADAETIWCGDVSVLQERLGSIGGGLQIEKALPVGATPLKRVVGAATEDRHVAREGPSTRTKTLR
jgi:hypothetical protein